MRHHYVPQFSFVARQARRASCRPSVWFSRNLPVGFVPPPAVIAGVTAPMNEWPVSELLERALNDDNWAQSCRGTTADHRLSSHWAPSDLSSSHFVRYLQRYLGPQRPFHILS